ncbi:MAG: hypothetical protein D6823_04835, partial [Chloroflexi bacterium]
CVRVINNEPFSLDVTGFGFTPGERIGLYATYLATGAVIPIDNTGDSTADAEGRYVVGITGSSSNPSGLYAITMEGVQSGNKAIVYFKVIR